jgi:hypothetical protein
MYYSVCPQNPPTTTRCSDGLHEVTPALSAGSRFFREEVTGEVIRTPTKVRSCAINRRQAYEP